MIKAGTVPVQTTSDTGQISVSYSRKQLASEFQDDLWTFNQQLDQTAYHKVFVRPLTPADLSKYPELEYQGAYLLFPAGTYAVIRCDAPLPEPPKPDPSAPAKAHAILRVRGDPKDLRNALKEDSKPATFTVNKDFEKSIRSFQTNTVVGIGIEGPLINGPSRTGIGYDTLVNGQLILYGQLNQKGADNAAALEIDNKALGLLGDIDFSFSDAWENNLSLIATYTFDDKVESRIESARLIWTPLPSWSPDSDAVQWFLRSFRNAAPIVLGPRATFMLHNQVSGEIVGARAVEAGTSPIFADDKEYFQAGLIVGTSLTWVNLHLFRFGKSEGLLRDLTLFAQYTWLDGITGALETFERLEAGVTIMFGDSQNFGWTTKYVNGRLDDTLQEVEYVESAVSVKF
jgi:hypothetical protein